MPFGGLLTLAAITAGTQVGTGLYAAHKAGDAQKKALKAAEPAQQAQTEMLRFQTQRAKQTQPNFEALLRMAQAMMPGYATQGMPLNYLSGPSAQTGARKPSQPSAVTQRAWEKEY